MSKQTVAVAMSGGVDSTLVTQILKEEGYNVIGITMKLWDGTTFNTNPSNNTCYGPGEIKNLEEIKRFSKSLGVTHYTIDLSKEFKANVLDYFTSEYIEGKTPNPCVVCNRKLKFNALIETAKKQGIKFDFFATGHYVRTEFDKETNRYLLKKGIDESKDQSYFLYTLTQDVLKQTLFPLGDRYKTEIKEKAKGLELGLEEKKESQNFLAEGHTAYLEATTKSVQGDFIDAQGTVLGKHKGIQYYTIGQRKGLGLSHHNTLYVVNIDKKTNCITLGDHDAIYSSKLIANNLNWIQIVKLTKPMKVSAKTRYQQKVTPATIVSLENGNVEVSFSEPQMAIAPGQSVVFYNDDIVIGGGIIL